MGNSRLELHNKLLLQLKLPTGLSKLLLLLEVAVQLQVYSEASVEVVAFSNSCPLRRRGAFRVSRLHHLYIDIHAYLRNQQYCRAIRCGRRSSYRLLLRAWTAFVTRGLQSSVFAGLPILSASAVPSAFLSRYSSVR